MVDILVGPQRMRGEWVPRVPSPGRLPIASQQEHLSYLFPAEGLGGIRDTSELLLEAGTVPPPLQTLGLPPQPAAQWL